jgi:hypothetical protein
MISRDLITKYMRYETRAAASAADLGRPTAAGGQNPMRFSIARGPFSGHSPVTFSSSRSRSFSATQDPSYTRLLVCPSRAGDLASSRTRQPTHLAPQRGAAALLKKATTQARAFFISRYPITHERTIHGGTTPKRSETSPARTRRSRSATHCRARPVGRRDARTASRGARLFPQRLSSGPN